ncbi:hypothetical protein [Allorhizobium borbori]|uniref:Uncharacterized protein n=1 Tax=Allorhizobium borbori TaxID=485907 RepID=A0A7W6P274_9HYPH|nr:hypothetical protein [Allorhizobium borbori]MBB4103554.1 hypothetical protein [Allorhizobium borbori]
MKISQKSKRDGSAQITMGRLILKERPARFSGQPTNWRFSIEFLRLRELEQLIRHRHQRGIPDPAGTDDFDSCFAYLFVAAATPRSQPVASWCQTWAPWVSGADLADLAHRNKRRRHMLSADAAAKILHVTMKERDDLGLKTIGACDVSAEDRKSLAKETKRERDKRRQAAKRRAEGAENRNSYTAESINRLKPWEAEGISRRTWYRRRGTGPSPIEVYTTRDGLVPNLKKGTPAPQQKQDQGREASLIEGLGDHPPVGLQGALPHGKCDVQNGRAA